MNKPNYAGWWICVEYDEWDHCGYVHYLSTSIKHMMAFLAEFNLGFEYDEWDRRCYIPGIEDCGGQ